MATINGLSYAPEFLTTDEHDRLVQAIDAHGWQRSGQMKRLVQQYGFAYNHQAQDRRPERVEPFPAWLEALAALVAVTGRFKRKPDQAIINRYAPGEGIGPHLDFTRHFGDTVASVSLLSDAVMDFTSVEDRTRTFPMLLERGSAVILAGDARYKWKHGIALRHVDRYKDRDILRGVRYSVTFRTML